MGAWFRWEVFWGSWFDSKKVPQKVVDIVDKEIGNWEVDAVENWLTSNEKNAILEITIFMQEEPYKLIWPHSESEVYSVKSGYFVKRSEIVVSSANKASSSHVVEGKLWKKIWSLRVPSKIKAFLWRACLNALLTGHNLWKMRCVNDAKYGICEEVEESVEHMLITCE
ncbi:hypothetical protein REPUB_Repub09cG0115800 [Reevesia pubescens]